MIGKHDVRVVALHIGSRLRLRRKLMGFSQRTLGADLGVKASTIAGYEAGRTLSAALLFHVARSLKCSVAFFYEGLADPLGPQDA